MPSWMETLFSLLALPQYGLSTLFAAAFISATLLPVGSEPALFGLLKLNPDLFWPAILVATAGILVRVLAVALPLGLIALLAWAAGRVLRRRRRESALV